MKQCIISRNILIFLNEDQIVLKRFYFKYLYYVHETLSDYKTVYFLNFSDYIFYYNIIAANEEIRICNFDFRKLYLDTWTEICVCVKFMNKMSTYSAFVSGVGKSPIVVRVNVDQYKLPRYFLVKVA